MTFEEYVAQNPDDCDWSETYQLELAWNAAYAAGRKEGLEEAARIAEDAWTDEFTSPNKEIAAAIREAAK